MGCCQSNGALSPSRMDSEADDEFQENPMGRMSGELHRPKSIRRGSVIQHGDGARKRKWTVS